MFGTRSGHVRGRSGPFGALVIGSGTFGASRHQQLVWFGDARGGSGPFGAVRGSMFGARSGHVRAVRGMLRVGQYMMGMVFIKCRAV